MIEFKAECGHTVRARDEDAGGTVRCSYCGRNAAVPDNANRDLDFLFAEVQQPAQEGGGRKRRRKARKEAAAARPKRPGEFNPFAVILRLVYAAALIMIVVVVARKFVIPMFDSQKYAARLSGTGPGAKTAAAKEDAAHKSQPRGPGYICEPRPAGLYVASTPPGAKVFCVDESRAPTSGRIHQVSGCLTGTTPGGFPRAGDGNYVVEVVFPWNDRNLTDSSLSNYQKYMELRKKLRDASSEQRKQLLDDYFLPDEASAFFVDQADDQIYLVRQYRGVSVRGSRSAGVRSVFLPKLFSGADAKKFQLEPLMTGYIPDTKCYEFDERHVRSELGFYDVAEADQPWVLTGLSRIGAIPCMTTDRRLVMFKIDVHTGALGTPEIHRSPR